jgi:hypothetical protein
MRNQQSLKRKLASQLFLVYPRPNVQEKKSAPAGIEPATKRLEGFGFVFKQAGHSRTNV